MDLKEQLLQEVKTLFEGEASGHDYWHSLRVYHNAMQIAGNEACDQNVVLLGALLHDADDQKLFDSFDYENARRIMKKCGVDENTESRVIQVIQDISFKGDDTVTPDTIEGKIVQDADRLDAIGAIGIARAFAYGGSRGRAIYDPEIQPSLHMNAQEYKNHVGTTVNHFYEKLLLLTDLMNTPSARKIAKERTKYMEDFLQRFYDEWNGIA